MIADGTESMFSSASRASAMRLFFLGRLAKFHGFSDHSARE
jgi:hypothetical protein